MRPRNGQSERGPHGCGWNLAWEATGTPTGEFWGAAPTGKGFKTMAIDLFTVRDGKLASAYHIENWMAALEQMRR